MVMTDGTIRAGPAVSYGSGFLPAIYQGTVLRAEGTPISNLTPTNACEQRTVLDALNRWDGHGECAQNHAANAARTDQPIAALLADLKQRGLLESTLVVWAGEFGRTPVMQGGNGRDHNPYGFSVWMAGGGVRGGQAIAATHP